MRWRVAKALDAEFARTGRLTGPLHGIPFAIKDQFDTFDMRSTSGAAAHYANDRPPADAAIVARLRKAGAIILAKANMGEYASGDRSTHGGATCNPYDTSRSAGRSSGGSGAAVAANLVTLRHRRGNGALGAQPGGEQQHRRHRRHAQPREPRRNQSGLAHARSSGHPVSHREGRGDGVERRLPDTIRAIRRLRRSAGQVPDRRYERYADNATLKGMRIGCRAGVVRPFTTADEDSIRVAEQALNDLAKAGATLVDPGRSGALFAQAIAALLPSLNAPMMAAVFQGGCSRPERR